MTETVTFTVARCVGDVHGRPVSLSKTYSLQIGADGSPCIGKIPYSRGYLFRLVHLTVAPLAELYDGLVVVSDRQDCCVFRGVPASWVRSNQAVRRTLSDKPDQPASIEDRASTLIILDVDGVPAGEVEQAPLDVQASWALDKLGIGSVSCIAQATNSAGIARATGDYV